MQMGGPFLGRARPHNVHPRGGENRGKDNAWICPQRCYLHINYVQSPGRVCVCVCARVCVCIMIEWAHVGVCERGNLVLLASSFLSEIKVKWVIYHEHMWLGHFPLVCVHKYAAVLKVCGASATGVCVCVCVHACTRSCSCVRTQWPLVFGLRHD